MAPAASPAPTTNAGASTLRIDARLRRLFGVLSLATVALTLYMVRDGVSGGGPSGPKAVTSVALGRASDTVPADPPVALGGADPLPAAEAGGASFADDAAGEPLSDVPSPAGAAAGHAGGGRAPQDPPSRRGQARKCIAEIIPTCNNRGMDRCQWRSTPCGFGPVEPHTFEAIFRNKTIVFHGDSTLRELFSAWSYYCCPGTGEVAKADTNMTSRAVVARVHPTASMRSFFRFDYLFDHLVEPMAEAQGLPVDVAVIGLGMYHAKAIATNDSSAVNFTEIKTRLVQHVVSTVCDVHRAKAGLFVATWMECAAMKKHKAKAVRQNGLVCAQSAQALSVVNRIVSMALDRQPPRPDGCRVHFVRPIRCTKVRHPCTGDGVHARSGSEYGASRFGLLYNALRILLV